MVDVVFLIDSSDSTTQTDFQKAIIFIKQFVTAENVGPRSIRVSVVSFAAQPHLNFPLGLHTDRTSLLFALERVGRLQGSTDTAKALNFAKLNSFADGGGKKVVVVITGGNSDDLYETDVAAQSLRSDGVTIFSVAMGQSSLFEQNKIAGNRANIMTNLDFSTFHNAFNKLSTC